MKEYIKDTEFGTLINDILYKLENGEKDECVDMLRQMADDCRIGQKYIDRTYLGALQERKRLTRISEISAMLEKMSGDQVKNVYSYTVDEFDEPNHEAEALDAIMKLSRRKIQEEKGSPTPADPGEN